MGSLKTTKESVYTTEMDSQTEKTNLWLAKARGRERTRNKLESMGLIDTDYYRRSVGASYHGFATLNFTV